MVKRLVCACLLLLVLSGGHPAAQQLALDGFVATPGVTSAQAGDWHTASTWTCTTGSQCTAGIPNSTAWVQINHAVTISANASAWTIYVAPAGSFTGTGTFTLTFSDTAIADTAQFDTGLIVAGGFTFNGSDKLSWGRLTAAVANGATSVTLDETPTGWVAGDRVVIMDTREIQQGGDGAAFPFQSPGVFTIDSIASNTVTFTSAAAHAFPCAKSALGVCERFPPIANLTRSIKITSANPSGTHRAHTIFADNAVVNIDNVQFLELGRTDGTANLNAVTNHIGRYPPHFHHLHSTPPVMQHSVVEGSPKWGITIHHTDGGTFSDNVVYDVYGWGIGTEDGSEADNVIDHNFVCYVDGNSNRGDGNQDVGEWGRNGTGIWLLGPLNSITDNVVGNSRVYGISVWDALGNNEQDPERAIPEGYMDGNEVIANHTGFAPWNISGPTITAYSYIDNMKEWHSAKYGVYNYPTKRMVFRNYWSRGDPAQFGGITNNGIWFGDYDTVEGGMINPDIQNKWDGIALPYGNSPPAMDGGTTPHAFYITGGTFNGNQTDISAVTVDTTVDECLSTGYAFTATGLTHGSASTYHYKKDYTGTGPLTRPFTLRVYDYQGVSGDNFEVYAAEQAGSQVVPTTDGTVCGTSVAGRTNTQLFAATGAAIYGEVMPGTATTRTKIADFLVTLSGSNLGRIRLRIRRP